VRKDSPQPMGLVAGSRIGGYLLGEQIGQGGMAVVFRALDERLGRQVALKVLSPALAADSGFRQRFIRESRAAAAVDDPHIIPVFEAGEADGVLFIAMRYVRGGDVRALLSRDGALPAARVAGIVSPLASALDAAHAAGLVHRDVKPANMLLDTRPGRPDHVYLSDFGLSKEAVGSAGLTVSGQFLGTVDYVAPEQIEGRVVDGRADQYALGCAAFEMLCGQPPFRRDQPMAALYAHMSEPPPQVTARRPDLPAALDLVFARVLAKSPGDRYGNCRMFSDALRTSLGIAPYAADPPPHHAATEAARTGHTAPAQTRGTAGTTTPAAGLLPGPGTPTIPPRARHPDPLRRPPPGHPSQSKHGTHRWPVAATAIAAVIAVAVSVVALQSHTPGASASPGTSPATTRSPNAPPASAPSSSVTQSNPGGAAAQSSAGSGGQDGGSAAQSSLDQLSAIESQDQSTVQGLAESSWVPILSSKRVGTVDPRDAEFPNRAYTNRMILRNFKYWQNTYPSVLLFQSQSYSSLVPGYWIIIINQPYSASGDVISWCLAQGLNPDDCDATLLSNQLPQGSQTYRGW
jgi:serine/threonine protein kinase